jgi:hypothetical protein
VAAFALVFAMFFLIGVISSSLVFVLRLLS